MKRQNLTKTLIAGLPLSHKAYVIGDTEVSSLVVRVGKRSRTFYVDRKFEGERLKIKVGNADLIAPALARKKALEILGRISAGQDPRKAPRTGITLREVYEDFKQHRELRPKTIRSYDSVFKNHMEDLMDLPIDKIQPETILSIHEALGKSGHKQYANQVMRTVRSVLNYAKGKYKNDRGERVLKENPVQVLSETKTWYRPKRRKTIIQRHQIAKWVSCIESMQNNVAGDLYLLLLLTGLRLDEARTLMWQDVDMGQQTFTIKGEVSKNYEDHIVPMTTRVRSIFERRLRLKVNGYVFPGADTCVVNVRRQRDQIVKESSIVFTPHDLRRTFITAAESLDLNGYLLKRLLNHKGGDDDVTGGYIVWNPMRLLKPLQQIEDLLVSSQ